MKKYYLLLLLFSLSAFANTLNIEKMSTMSGFEIAFKLTPFNQTGGHIVLDCQSYFHKFDFYDQDNKLAFENYITIDECKDLFLNTKSCLSEQGKKCFDPNNIFDTNCGCK